MVSCFKTKLTRSSANSFLLVLLTLFQPIFLLSRLRCSDILSVLILKSLEIRRLLQSKGISFLTVNFFSVFPGVLLELPDRFLLILTQLLDLGSLLLFKCLHLGRLLNREFRLFSLDALFNLLLGEALLAAGSALVAQNVILSVTLVHLLVAELLRVKIFNIWIVLVQLAVEGEPIQHLFGVLLGDPICLLTELVGVHERVVASLACLERCCVPVFPLDASGLLPFVLGAVLSLVWNVLPVSVGADEVAKIFADIDLAVFDDLELVGASIDDWSTDIESVGHDGSNEGGLKLLLDVIDAWSRSHRLFWISGIRWIRWVRRISRISGIGRICGILGLFGLRLWDDDLEVDVDAFLSTALEHTSATSVDRDDLDLRRWDAEHSSHSISECGQAIASIELFKSPLKAHIDENSILWLDLDHAARGQVEFEEVIDANPSVLTAERLR